MNGISTETKNHVKRRSKILRLFHPKSPSNVSISSATFESPIPQEINMNIGTKFGNHKNQTKLKHRRQNSQFEKLKSVIAKFVPGKNVKVNPKKSKQNDYNKDLLMDTHQNNLSDLYKNQILHELIEIDYNASTESIDDDDTELSETEEYKDDLDENMPVIKPQLAPRSSSFMRSFEKRPEYTTYYAPASLMAVFKDITVDEEERSVTVETKSGIRTRLDSVDQLFELASATLDYSNFYGYNNDNMEHEPTIDHTIEVSVLSELPDDDEDINDVNNLNWQ